MVTSYNCTIKFLDDKLCVNEAVVLLPIALTSIRAAAVANCVFTISDVSATVPVASGSVTVLSAVSVPANKVSSFASATLPSNTTPFDVDTVSTLFVVVVPVTCKSPGITTVVVPAPIVRLFAPTPSKIVLSPDVRSISVSPVSVVSVPPIVIVESPIVILRVSTYDLLAASVLLVGLPKFIILWFCIWRLPSRVKLPLISAYDETSKDPAINTDVDEAPIVNVAFPTPSKIVLLPAVRSISVSPVSVVSVPPNAIVESPIVMLLADEERKFDVVQACEATVCQLEVEPS